MIVALVLVSLVLTLGYLSLRAVGFPAAANAQESALGVQVRPLLLVGVSVLIILFILLSSLAILHSFRQQSQARDQELEALSRELTASREKLLVALGDLQSTNAFQRSVLESLSDPIMVIDLDYRVRLMNKAALASSVSLTERASMRCFEIGHHRQAPCDGIEHPCPLVQVREFGAPVTVIHEHYQADGRRRFVEVAASPLTAEDGSLDGIVETLRDITQPVRTAQALKAANRLQQLLVDEVRERIARDLHDGLAQLLGYVNTKVAAVRLMLKNQQLDFGRRAFASARRGRAPVICRPPPGHF